MKYSEQITIGIPVRIDSPARMRNLQVLLRHLSLSGIKIHVWEAGDVRSELSGFASNKDTYTYERDESLVYHKTLYVNRLLKAASTPVVAIWDADILLPLSQIEASVLAIIEQGYLLSIPYDGVVKMLSEAQSEAFEYSGQGCDYLTMFAATYARLMRRPSCGGVFVVDREKYLHWGGDNERFVSWGPEDAERIRRIEILGYPVHWVKEGPLYHLWHPRGENSGYATEELAFQNRMEFIKVCSMERNELREYIKSCKNNG